MLDVVAAIIFNHKNEVLIAKRALHKQLGGLWEFPGGKIEKKETKKAALERELEEEFDIISETKEHFITVEKKLGEQKIRVISYFSQILYGNIKLREHDEIQWVKPAELVKFKLASADVEIAKELIKQLGH